MISKYGREVGERINEIRVRRGFHRMNRLARKCGWSDDRLYRLLAGTQIMTVSDLLTVCNALSCSADEILNTKRYYDFIDYSINTPLNMIIHNFVKMDVTEQQRLAIIAEALAIGLINVAVTHTND